MATGVPVIATNWSGPVDFVNDKVGWLLDYQLVPAVDFEKNVYKEYCGDWAEPSFDHLVKLFRYAYEHQDEVKEKGNIAAEYVKNEWTWEKKILMYVEALSKHL